MASLRQMTVVTVLLLVVQFLLGTAVNLFVTISSDHSGAEATSYFGRVIQSVVSSIAHGPLVLVLHSLLGLILVVGSVGVLVVAIR